MLRGVIKDLTGEELRTRHEVLEKGCSSYVILRVTANIFYMGSGWPALIFFGEQDAGLRDCV